MQITPGQLRVSPGSQVKQQIGIWAAQTAQLADVVDPVKLHVTLAYINKPGWFPVRVQPRREYLATVGHLELFGDQDTLVITLNSEMLQIRFQGLVEAGYQPDFTPYRPHITIKKNAACTDLHKAELQFFNLPVQLITLSDEQWLRIDNEN